jgi:hypothetical protein
VEPTQQIEIISPEQLRHALEHIDLKPGEECIACHRTIPRKQKDDNVGRQRAVVSISEPVGYEGTLEPLMIAVVDKYRDAWPRDYAAMRDGIGLEVVGGRSWKYFVTHFALYAVLQVPGLEPTE